MADASGQLLPTELQYWNAAKQRVNRAYDMGTGQNKHDRGLAQYQYDWDRQDMLKRLADQRNAIPGQFNRRGMMNSGLYQRGLADYTRDSTRSTQRLDTAHYLRQAGFNLVDNQLKRIRDESLTDITDQQAALRELRATTLRSVM